LATLSATGSAATTTLSTATTTLSTGHHGLNFFFGYEAILVGIQPFKERGHLRGNFVFCQLTIGVLVVFKHPVDHLVRIESASPTFLSFGLGDQHDRNGCHH
jgi:hypothetical protein